MANFVHALVAVLVGNVAYFLLMPYLPRLAQHVPLQIDLGIAVDFAFCLAIFGMVKALVRRKRTF